MSKVVILGAGSSKECGLPLGNEVWDCLEYNSGPPWYRFLKDTFPHLTMKEYPPLERVLALLRYCVENGKGLGIYKYDELIENSLISSYKETFFPRTMQY